MEEQAPPTRYSTQIIQQIADLSISRAGLRHIWMPLLFIMNAHVKHIFMIAFSQLNLHVVWGKGSKKKLGYKVMNLTLFHFISSA